MDPVLLYDGECGFCKRWVAWCRDRQAQVAFRPCQDADGLRKRWSIPESRCKETAIYIDAQGPRTHQDAINAVLGRIPKRRWRLLALLGGVPGIHAIEGITYRLIARNRHRLRGPP